MYQVQPHPASTGIKLQATYPAIRLRQAGKVVAATLIAAILVIGVVELSLGLGSQSRVGVGPDHPPAPLAAPAPAPPPQLPAVSPRPEPAGG